MHEISDFNQDLTLYKIATSFVKQGFSLIPVFDNKVAAIEWKAYQSQLPTPTNLAHWFKVEQFSAIGIICGQISTLIAIDFDTPAAFARFKSEHPELTDSFTVKTRRGKHIWYRISAGKIIHSRHGDGVDLLAEGKYAIAPGSTINEHTYTIENDCPIRDISSDDIQKLQAFVGTNVIQNNINIGERAVISYSADDLQALYHAHAHEGNRNTALFYATLAARDTGWSAITVINTLADCHVATGLPNENPNSRYREAVATIQSAFSRPPRQQETTLTLPNNVKEKLFQDKLTCVIRVVETLLPHTQGEACYMTYDEMKELMPNIGHHSLKKALKTGFFEVQEGYEAPSPSPPTPVATATSMSNDIQQICYLLGSENRQKVQTMGRPTKYYRIPALHEWFKLLGLTPSRLATPIPQEALNTAKNTRQAYYRGFIDRRPGEYPTQWLANLTGVHIVTKNRYDKEIPDLHKASNYLETPLDAYTLDKIPDDAPFGFFLMDDTGKRYPPNASLAQKLLRQGRRVSLMQQWHNYYWVGNPFDAPISATVAAHNAKYAPPEPENGTSPSAKMAVSHLNRANSPISCDLTHMVKHPQTDKTVFKTPQEVSKLQESPTHNPRRKFNDYRESATEWVQERINGMVTAKNHISRKTVRELILQHGVRDVKRSVRIIQSRDNVENAAGLLIVMLRSNAKKQVLKRLFG